MDKLRALNYFAAVAETGSFSQAAKQFKVPPSSLSRRVADLEADLGATLLLRSTRVVKLTEIGQQYYQTIRGLLDQLAEADESVRTYQAEPQGILTISAMTLFGEARLVPLLDAFRARYPKITLDLHLSDEVTQFSRGGVDLAFRGGFAPNERVVAVRLLSNEFAPVAAPSYVKQFGMPDSPADLAHHRGLFYRSPQRTTPWLGLVDGVWQDVAPPAEVISNAGSWLLEQVLAGRGILMLPPWASKPYIESGQLQAIEFDPPLRMTLQGEPGVFMLYPKQRYQVPKVKAAVDFFTAALKE